MKKLVLVSPVIHCS